MHLLLQNSSPMSTLLNKEIKLNHKDLVISRTDFEGNILFYNNNFAKISGYSREELLHAPHSILRHPEMPQAIFYLLWQQLLAGRSTKAIIKNFSKDGNYYWLTLTFTPLKDKDLNIVSFSAHGIQTSQEAIDKIEPLYAKILEYEKHYDMHRSIKFFSDHLTDQNIASYNDYIHKVTNKKREGFFSYFKI